jgi:Na+/melibiose symporter-like transporter
MSSSRRLLYGCGQVGMMGLTRYLYGWILDYSSAEGPGGRALFSAAAVGAVFLAFRIFDAVADPVAGHLSDRWVRRGRERRRLLWLSFALPPLGLALCFAPDHGMAEGPRWALLVSGLLLFFVGYTFYAIPYWSLIDDYSGEDRENRRVLSTVLGAGLMVATGIGFVASPGLVEAHGFLAGALAFALPGGILMVLPYFASPARTGSAAEPRPGRTGSFLAGLKLALGHRRFLAFLVLFSGSQMAFTIMTAAAPFIAVDLLGGSRSDVALLLGPLLGAAVLTFVVVPRISRSWGWERALALASLTLAGVYCLSAGLGRSVVGTPLTTAMVIFGLAGPMTAVLLGLESEAIAACAQERGGDAVSTYFGVFNLVVKALNGVALLLAGLLADASRGETGSLAVRLMPIAAGGCLLLCLALSFAIRRGGPAR